MAHSYPEQYAAFLSFFLILGDTRSLRMPALRPASQAGPVRNPREGTSVTFRDTIRLTCAPRTVGPGSNLAVHVNRTIDGRQGIQQEAICYQ